LNKETKKNRVNGRAIESPASAELAALAIVALDDFSNV
jgi:hypothetical protein